MVKSEVSDRACSDHGHWCLAIVSREVYMEERKSRSTKWWTALVTVISVVGGTGWIQFFLEKRDSAKRERERVVFEYLQPIQRYLEDNAAIFTELKGPRYSEPGMRGILETYLLRIRRDGVSAHPIMRERITTLVKNNNQVVALLQSYNQDFHFGPGTATVYTRAVPNTTSFRAEPRTSPPPVGSRARPSAHRR